jgi:hypothetical protein
MIEQAVIHPAEAAHKSHGRTLHGFRLWAARSAYILLFLLVAFLFIFGLKPFIESWHIGNVGAWVTADAEGNLTLTVLPASDAKAAGIQDGDLLKAINGTPMTTVVQANQALAGTMGQPVTLTVLSRHSFPRDIELTYGGGFLQLLDSMHLSLNFLVVYNLVFSCVLGLAVILCSPLVFFRRSNDWLVILVAFAMVAFASYLLTPVAYGAQKLGVYFLNNIIYMVGMVSMVLVFLIFPTGHFSPRWTKWASLLLIFPAVVDFINLQTYRNTVVDFFLWAGFFVLVVFAQLYRFRRVSTASERQQTKRVMLGAVACFSIIILLDLALMVLTPRVTYAQYVFLTLFTKAATNVPILILEVSFVLAIYRYRLWDMDLYINRTIVYTLVTIALIGLWVLTTQFLNYASQQLLGKQVGWVGAILSSLQVAVIYKPVRTWAEKWVNNRFYKDRIDYEKALVELKPEMWTYLTPVDLGHTLVMKVPELVQASCAALFLQERTGLVLSEVQEVHPFEAKKVEFSSEIMKKLSKGEAFSLPNGQPFNVLVPLVVQRLQMHDLIGVLAMGTRTKGRGYSRDHLADLTGLGHSAGVALYMLKMNEKKIAKNLN